MSNTKKHLAKTSLVIDLRPIQDFKYNGVTIAGQNWISEIIKQSKNDQPIILWSNSNKNPPVLPKDWLHKKNIKHIHTNLSNLFLNLKWSFKIGQTLDKILKINQNYFYFCPDIRPFKTSKNCLKTSIYFHDIAFIKHNQSLSLKSKIWFKLIRPHQIYSSADQILTNSKFSLKEIQSYFQKYKPKQNIKVIHPSLNKNLKTNPNFSLPESNYFLTISTFQTRKNLNSLIKLFQTKNFKNQNLVILGHYDEMFQDPQLKTSKNIYLLQNLSQQDKHQLIKKCKALIYPSLYEGFGLPILEAIRFKKAIFCNPIKPFTELFPKHIYGLKDLNPNNLPNPNKNHRIYPLNQETRKLIKSLKQLD